MEIRENEKAAAGYRILRHVAAAHGVAMLACVVLVETLIRNGFTAPALITDTTLATALLLLVSTALFFAGGRVRDGMLQPRFDALEEALVPGERLRRMLSANVVAFAACEVAGFLGLLLFFLGGTRTEFYLLNLLGAIFLGLRMPNPRQWQAWYAQRTRLR